MRTPQLPRQMDDEHPFVPIRPAPRRARVVGEVSDEIESLDVGPSLTVADLERWVAFGATWRLVDLSDRGATVDLCQCTGELVERRASTDPIVLEYLRNHAPDDV